MNTAATESRSAVHRLSATGLQKSYGARKVVKDVHLSVDAGEVVGLLGPNGAGKTTSFYMIVGLVPADAGEITIEGQRVERLPIHKRSRLGLSYLPQEASIFRKLNVEENIRAVLELQLDAHGKTFRPAVIEELRGRGLAREALIAGGRSLGARVACRTAAQTGATGVLCLAFPLHPPGRADDPDKSRQPELDAVEVPTLVVQGRSDPFGMPAGGPGREIAVVAGNHGLKADLEGVGAAVAAWLPTVIG